MDKVLQRNPRRQGDLGEHSAITWLLSRGADVFLPMSYCRDFDLIAYVGEGLLRVQAKTSTQFRNGRWCTAVCTRGGNRSWEWACQAPRFLAVRVPVRARW